MAPPMTLAGYRQTKDVDISLLVTSPPLLSSTEPSATFPELPIFRGKESMHQDSGAGSSNTKCPGTASKVTDWHRGIAPEFSPLQTRSSRKQKELLNSSLADSDSPPQQGKALRALKALARSK